MVSPELSRARGGDGSAIGGDGELRGEGESCEWLGRVADDLQRLEGGLFIAGAKAPELVSAEHVRPRLCRPQQSRGEVDERQRVTETSSARRRMEEEDTGEEGDDAQERTVPVVGTARRRRKRRGPEVQGEDEVEGEL